MYDQINIVYLIFFYQFHKYKIWVCWWEKNCHLLIIQDYQFFKLTTVFIKATKRFFFFNHLQNIYEHIFYFKAVKNKNIKKSANKMKAY